MVRTWTARIALVVACFGVCSGKAEARSGDPGVVAEWNQLLQNNMPAGAGLQAFRYYAMLHIAMFDAVTAIEPGRYYPYRVRLFAAPVASSEAAAAQAAHDVLVAVNPGAAANFDAALAARLQNIHPVPRALGVKVGAHVAAEVLAWRLNDGWSAPAPPYVLPPLPGLWQPTPPANAPAGFTQVPKTTPFALLTATQYLPDPPPTLTSARYTTDFNEVKAIGAVNSVTRTDEQTLIARLFAGVITPTNLNALWSNVARDTAASRGLDLLDTARTFMFVTVAMSDGLLTSHSSKFVYALWRPVTAIRRADEDLNPGTDPDGTWSSLLTTPPYPAYAGNMACVGISAATVLGLVFDTDDVAFTAVWRNTSGPNYTRDYASFTQMAQDQANSRIYGGIHFRFDNDASQAVCPKVAQFAFANYARPK